MDDLPYWLRVSSALGPIVLGMAVAYIAYRQWRTAKDKLVLDLFDRRFAWYRSFGLSLNAMTSAPSPEMPAAFDELMRLVQEGRFLFGPDVGAILDKITLPASEVTLATVKGEGGKARRQALLEERIQRFLPAMVAVQFELASTVGPYLRMPHHH